jgi:hypothetical protein
MKTRTDFLEAVQHECRGFILDGLIADRKGSELSQWLKLADANLRRRLNEIYEQYVKQLEPVTKPPAPNGAANSNQARKV